VAWAMPLASWRVSSRWGWRSRGFHRGVDLAAPTGTPVHSVAGGRVVKVWRNDPINGNALRVLHTDGTGAGYAHLHTLAVGEGQRVARGELLGTVGSTGRSTGPHLHLTAFNSDGNRVDPARFLGRIRNQGDRRGGAVLGLALLVGALAASAAAGSAWRE
jgi:murein DD-endopeptidase MepM/ murein hydrolase activator NlpD